MQTFDDDKIRNAIYSPWHHIDECGCGDLVGMTFIEYKVADDAKYIAFKNSEGEIYLFFHQQDCCEDVYLEDITGELDDMLHAPILRSEESSNHQNNDDDYESVTWTFYKFATDKGYVDMRWCGSSNGYYSESVSLGKLKV